MTNKQAAEVLRALVKEGMGLSLTSIRPNGATEAMVIASQAMEEWDGRYHIAPKSRVIMKYLAGNPGAVIVMEPGVKNAFEDAIAVLSAKRRNT